MREPEGQRRVSRAWKTSLLPLVLLIFFGGDLVWEIVKANVNAGARGRWPWRFTIVDENTSIAAVGVLAGILITRTQVSQTLRPILSWSATTNPSRWLSNARRTVHLHNGGGGRAVVVSVAYQIECSSRRHPAAEPDSWLGWGEAIDVLKAAGIEAGRSVYLLYLGLGSAIPMATRPSGGFELAAFSPSALDSLDRFTIKIRVVDVLGDEYERILHCVEGPNSSELQRLGPPRGIE